MSQARSRSRGRKQGGKYPLFYVDIDGGCDANCGSMLKPVASVGRALALVRMLNEDEDFWHNGDLIGETVVLVRCGSSCRFLPCCGPQQCTAQICESHGDGAGRFYTEYGWRHIAFQINKCKEAGCRVTFCQRHDRLILDCEPCAHTFRTTADMIGEDHLPYRQLVCRTHGRVHRKNLDADSESWDDRVRFDVRSFEGLDLDAMNIPDLQAKILSVASESGGMDFAAQLIQMSTVQDNLIGISIGGDEKFRISITSMDQELITENLHHRIQDTLAPNFVVLGLYGNEREMAPSEVIVNLSEVTIKVITKKQVVQQVRNAIDADMVHEMSTCILDSDSDQDPETCGLFCCPACYNDRVTGFIQ